MRQHNSLSKLSKHTRSRSFDLVGLRGPVSLDTRVEGVQVENSREKDGEVDEWVARLVQSQCQRGVVLAHEDLVEHSYGHLLSFAANVLGEEPLHLGCKRRVTLDEPWGSAVSTQVGHDLSQVLLVRFLDSFGAEELTLDLEIWRDNRLCNGLIEEEEELGETAEAHLGIEHRELFEAALRNVVWTLD